MIIGSRHGGRPAGRGRARIGLRPRGESPAALARSHPVMPARPALLLALLLAACAHRDAAADAPDAPDPPAVTQAQEEAPEPPAPTQPGPTAQVITFSGDDADPEPATQIRSPPKRPKLPSFQLYGTRTGDGPR